MDQRGRLRTSSHPQARTLFFITTEEGCFVPLSHKLNADGYFRKRWGGKGLPPLMEMFHRTIYRMHFGEIPEGYEVDHKCGMRPCCNPRHLRAIPGDDHAIESNRARRLGVGHPLRN